MILSQPTDILLDTHTLLWFGQDSSELPTEIRAVIEDKATRRAVSIVSFWEIGIKAGLGKLPLVQNLPSLEAGCRSQGIEVVPIDIPAISRMMQMPMHHRDPFDRIIAATALTSGLVLLSADAAFDAYGVHRVWG